MISTRGDFMKRVLAAAFLIAIGAVSALAAGYDDFSRGVNATNRGDADAAISSFTAALAAGDLAAAYVPNAHLGRARAYLQKDKCAEALSDLNETIKLKTPMPPWRISRWRSTHVQARPFMKGLHAFSGFMDSFLKRPTISREHSSCRIDTIRTGPTS
jgi:hypothetical protein